MKLRRMRWEVQVARLGKTREAYRIFLFRPEGKRPLGRPRYRWEDDIKVDLQDEGRDHLEDLGIDGRIILK